MSGCVRFPDFTVRTITSTDLEMSNFCETSKEIPKVFTVNVSSKFSQNQNNINRFLKKLNKNKTYIFNQFFKVSVIYSFPYFVIIIGRGLTLFCLKYVNRIIIVKTRYLRNYECRERNFFLLSASYTCYYVSFDLATFYFI